MSQRSECWCCLSTTTAHSSIRWQLLPGCKLFHCRAGSTVAKNDVLVSGKHFLFSHKPNSKISLVVQRLGEALLAQKLPNEYFLPSMTRVEGFSNSDPVVALAAGYMVWLALTGSGKVYACDTGFDGYAGLLPGTVQHRGWHKVNEVRQLSFVP